MKIGGGGIFPAAESGAAEAEGRWVWPRFLFQLSFSPTQLV